MRPLIMRELINDICYRWGIEKKVKEYTAMCKWRQVVGEKIASEAQPTGVKSGKLFVKVDNASWRNELIFMKRAIIDKINESIGSYVIKDIVFSGRKGANRKK